VIPIHQADAVLLGYPLQRFMTLQTQKNDLLLYQAATDPNAPPTTWAMHSIGWMQVGEKERADQNLLKQLNFTSKEFKVSFMHGFILFYLLIGSCAIHYKRQQEHMLPFLFIMYIP
jgi:hypothetical protein